MKYIDALKIIKDLPFDKKCIFYSDSDTELYVLRPSVLPKSLKNNYDPKKNFQIWLKEKNREFKPNHLRLMIDLNLRVRTNPELKKELLLAFDNIFYGEDPDLEIKKLRKEKFEHYLNNIEVIAKLAQLFIIEQEFNYNKKSNFEPKTLFFQGWIREFIDSPKEIDNMCMSVANGQPPAVKYTNLENKKSKKYNSKLGKLWYLQNE